MVNRTLEADRDGRLNIYPSLPGLKEDGLLRKIVKRIVGRLVKRRK